MNLHKIDIQNEIEKELARLQRTELGRGLTVYHKPREWRKDIAGYLAGEDAYVTAG